MAEAGKRYLMLGFDMEPDVGSTSSNYEGVQHGTRVILDILEKHGVRATFLFTGDCAKRNPGIVELVRAKGYEIGCHSLFHEDLGPPSFDTSSKSEILEEELENRLRKNAQIVKAISGADPVSFRSPRGFASDNLMRVLARLGFRVDSSYMQAMHLVRNFPYRVSKDDWKEEGDGEILELPLFAFDLENAADNTYQKKLDQWPRIRTHGARFVFDHMRPVVERQIEEKGLSALTFYLHPWEFHPMPEKIRYAEGTLYYDEFLYRNTGEAQARELDAFVGLCLKDGYTFQDFRSFQEVFTG